MVQIERFDNRTLGPLHAETSLLTSLLTSLTSLTSALLPTGAATLLSARTAVRRRTSWAASAAGASTAGASTAGAATLRKET